MNHFVVYGAMIEEEDFINRIKKDKFFCDEIVDIWNRSNQDNPEDQIQDIKEAISLDHKTFYECVVAAIIDQNGGDYSRPKFAILDSQHGENIYVGRSFDTIDDTETGQQFRELTENIVNKLLGKKTKCYTLYPEV